MPWLTNGIRRFDVDTDSPAHERLKKQGYEEEAEETPDPDETSEPDETPDPGLVPAPEATTGPEDAPEPEESPEMPDPVVGLAADEPAMETVAPSDMETVAPSQMRKGKG